MMPSAYAKSRYYGEMLDMEGVLDANALNDIVGRVAVDLRSSDYYLSQVLGRLSTQRSANTRDALPTIITASTTLCVMTGIITFSSS